MDISTTSVGGTGLNGAQAQLIKDSTTASFKADVIDESQNQPVLVDFWAPWCGPCRQLGPAIEKVVSGFAGKVKLVKINVDENQALAGQMGVQSIPAVFAFSGGRPVDGFMGALPESEIQRFVQKQIDGAGAAPGSPEAQIEEALAAATEAMEAKDYPGAEHVYAMILQYQPDNDAALIGLARIKLETGSEDGAEQILAQISEDGRKSADFAAVTSALQLRREAAGLGAAADLAARLESDPDDHQTRFDLAVALNASGEHLQAAEQLVSLMRRDRDWNDDAARKKLLELFEAWGPKDPATAKGRRMLSTALFS